MVERCLANARHFEQLVLADSDFEMVAPAPLNIVCFRYRPSGAAAHELDDLNERLGEAIMEDGRVYAGTTQYGGMTALRPAFVNWRTRPEHVELLMAVVKELAAEQ